MDLLFRKGLEGIAFFGNAPVMVFKKIQPQTMDDAAHHGQQKIDAMAEDPNEQTEQEA